MSAIPVYRDTYVGRAGVQRRSRRFADAANAVAFRIALFGLIVAAVYVAGGLAGNVMMENARREGLRAQERARAAHASEVALRESIDSLTSLSALNDWACAHGFRAPEQLARPAGGVTVVATSQ